MLKNIITDINKNEIAIMRTDEVSNEKDQNEYFSGQTRNYSREVMDNEGSILYGFKDGYINLPYKSYDDILTNNFGSFIQYQTENEYGDDIQDDCGSNDEELGEMLYSSLKDEYDDPRLESDEVYYNTLKSADEVDDIDSGVVALNGTTDNITIHAHNNAKSRKHISMLIKQLNPEFYKTWKNELEPKAIKADSKVNA